jgi:hypothetical protein
MRMTAVDRSALDAPPDTRRSADKIQDHRHGSLVDPNRPDTGDCYWGA